MPPKKKIKKKPDIKIKGINKKDFCNPNKKSYGVGGHGCNLWVFGSVLAMILSYTRNGSILWAILHGIFSGFYVLFRAMQIWGWF